ncbi:hypothetical protein EMCRGX_G015911 [Ephydatia muelleri]
MARVGGLGDPPGHRILGYSDRGSLSFLGYGCPKLNMTITLDNLNMIITLDNLNMTITLDNLNMTITLDNLTITLDNLNMTIIHDSLPQSGKSDVVMFSFRQQVLYTI